MTKAGDAGRDAENRVRDYLQSQGYTYARRIRQTGWKDEGDVILGDKYPVTVEVKGGQKNDQSIWAHGREMVDEVSNMDAETGFVVVKKARSSNVGEWMVCIPMEFYLRTQFKELYPPGR